MKAASEHRNEMMAKMTFASVYPYYVLQVEKTGRTKKELHQIITWLTSFGDAKIQAMIDEKVSFKTFELLSNNSE